jgi:hypothetical protein
LISNPDYGVYRLKLHFNLQEDAVSQAKIRRICRSNGITPKPKKKKPPIRDKNTPHTGVFNLIDVLHQQDLIRYGAGILVTLELVESGCILPR